MNVLPNNNLLTKLVANADTKFLLICDHLGSDSLPLIQSLIYNRLKQFNVNMVLIENTSDVYLSSFRKPTSDTIGTDIKTIDLFTKYDSIESNLSQHLVKSLTDLSEESIVLIDSLTPILLMDSLSELSTVLLQIANKFRQLICVLHVDCHSQYICESIEHLCQSVIHLTTKSDKTIDNCFKAIIRQRKPHRKTHFSVQQSMEFFTINEFNVICFKNIQKQDSNDEQTSSQTTADPTLNLPFNLNLNDKELMAKNSLILPYIKTDNESKVFYEFDKNDDMDEDDPDDDLDI